MYLRRLLSPHIWKRACSTAATPTGVNTSATASMAARAKPKAPTSVETSAAPMASGQKGKRKIYKKLQYLTVETVDLILREEEKKGIYVTETELLNWAKRLGKREGKFVNALAIFEWMDKKKITFSPSDLAYYVLLIDQVKGFDAADEFFQKVDPNFNSMDPKSKNWPAYSLLNQMHAENSAKSPRRCSLIGSSTARHGDYSN